MGLDAVILISGNVTQEMCDKANHRLRSLRVERETTYNNTFALVANNDSEEPKNGDVEFLTFWRYWGEGYERGPLFDILHVLCTAVWAFPDCQIDYGSDSDYADLKIFNPELLAELLRHYMSDDGDNYYASFDTAQTLMNRLGQ